MILSVFLRKYFVQRTLENSQVENQLYENIDFKLNSLMVIFHSF